MRFSDETLMAYADGELDAAARREIDAVIATEPDIARRVNLHKSLRARIGAEFEPVLNEPVPTRLLVAARRTGKPAWPQWGALAASFLLGALLWQVSGRFLRTDPIISRNGEVVAAGVLAEALTKQLAADQTSRSAVQLGVSFRSKAGDFCRTFLLRDHSATAGIACHQNDQWQVLALVHDATESAAQPQYRQAASALPPAVLQTVSDIMTGEPLGAAEEARARAQHWNASK